MRNYSRDKLFLKISKSPVSARQKKCLQQTVYPPRTLVIKILDHKILIRSLLRSSGVSLPYGKTPFLRLFDLGIKTVWWKCMWYGWQGSHHSPCDVLHKLKTWERDEGWIEFVLKKLIFFTRVFFYFVTRARPATKVERPRAHVGPARSVSMVKEWIMSMSEI